MKQIIFHIAWIGALLTAVSCTKENEDQIYKGKPQLTFEYPNVRPGASPTAWNGTAASIHAVTYSVDSGTVRTIDYEVSLIAGGPQGEIPFSVSVLEANSVTGAAAVSTIMPSGALTFASSGTIPAGRFKGTFQIHVDHSKLSDVAADNIVYLLLSPAGSGSSVQAAENYRRVRLNFTKAN